MRDSFQWHMLLCFAICLSGGRFLTPEHLCCAKWRCSACSLLFLPEAVIFSCLLVGLFLNRREPITARRARIASRQMSWRALCCHRLELSKKRSSWVDWKWVVSFVSHLWSWRLLGGRVPFKRFAGSGFLIEITFGSNLSVVLPLFLFLFWLLNVFWWGEERETERTGAQKDNCICRVSRRWRKMENVFAVGLAWVETLQKLVL